VNYFKKTIVDEGNNIRFVFEEGLHEDDRFKLPKDSNGFYYMTFTK
jgi:hypothetical protein